MTRTITTLALAGLMLTAACHNKKKPEAPTEPPPAPPMAPVTPSTPEQPAPVLGPKPG